MLKATRLTIEYRENPLGLDERTPRFSWRLESSKNQVMQAAYRLRVYAEDGDEPVWDSGKVASSSCVLAPYGGPPLTPRTRYQASVRVWDKSGHDSGFSPRASWETGLMGPEGFAAEFISATRRGQPGMGPALLLRRAFALEDKKIVRARLYASALGIYAAWINGKRVGDQLLAPGWTSYKSRLQYQTYDVTDMLEPGRNAIGATVADGWYRGYLAYKDNRDVYGKRLALIAQLIVDYEDGTSELVGTDDRWRFSWDGPVRYADFYMGTRYDARMEMPRWSEPGFEDGSWQSVSILKQTKQALVGQRDQPVKRVLTLAPVALVTTPGGERVIDMGQNMVGWPRFRARGRAGEEIRLRFGEVLDKDGNFYNENYRLAKSELIYIFGADGEATFEPDFTFYGFRYIKLEKWPEDARAEDFEGVVIASDLALTSGFECSDERVNQLFRNIQWGQRGNFVDVPTDCPQRDERLGWTGDITAFARTACINMDCAAMLGEWLKDLTADQRADGAVPHVVPQVLNADAYGSSAWGDAAVVVPMTLYTCYGDLRVLETQYPSMKAWIDYEIGQSKDYIWSDGAYFGDWLGLDAREGAYVGATDKSLIATAYMARGTQLLASAASALGLERDASEYQQHHKNMVRAYRSEFITASGRLAVRTQTAYALTLHFDLCEDAHRERMARELAALIDECGGHLTTGFVGTPHLCRALTGQGQHAKAGELFLRTDYPSWLYPITKGATTMWEHWDGVKPDGSFWSSDMNSFNHYAYGAIGEWMMRALAGIDALKPAYAELLLHPRPIEGISFVSAWQITPYGRVECEWRVEGESRSVRARIPAGARAMIVLEDAELCQVTDGERLLNDAPGIERAWQSDGDVLMRALSGEHVFRWRTAAC